MLKLSMDTRVWGLICPNPIEKNIDFDREIPTALGLSPSLDPFVQPFRCKKFTLVYPAWGVPVADRRS